jgi:hypothetical protein
MIKALLLPLPLPLRLPLLLLTQPSSSSTSLTLQGPISHWQVSAVASAFSLQENSGSGLENMTCSTGQQQQEQQCHELEHACNAGQVMESL